MPHRCTNCGRTFPDGSKGMLAGCPDCGGNKFQFLPPSAVDPDPAPDADRSTRDDPPRHAGPTPPTEPATADPAGGNDIIDADAEDAATDDAPEDRAQASARGGVVSDDELPPIGDLPSRDDAAEVIEPALSDDERPSLEELRAELNDQFESIKILRPGEYELNLMELYDRDEYIIALEEDGRYVIDVPSSWRDS